MFWMAVIAGVGHVALRRSGFGRKVLATGGGEMAARYSGIDTRSIVQGAGPVLLRCRTGRDALRWPSAIGPLPAWRRDELSVIAAAVPGGTSLFGGKGTVIGTIVGALMIGMINNGLILMGLEFSQQLIAKGAIIILPLP